MKFKSILSLTVFFAAFLFSAALVSLTVAETPVSDYGISAVRTNEATRTTIVRFLEKDVRNGVERDRRAFGLRNNVVSAEEYSAARTAIIAQYVERSSAMNESKLPQDLQIAWLKHMRAWHNYADYLEESAGNDSLNEGQACRYNREINTTWYEVLRIAGSYDAFVREY